MVRHAEKETSANPRDPGLTQDGRARAARLAKSLRHEPVVAAYATAYRRTQETAAPTAHAFGLPVTTYDAGLSAQALAQQLLREHKAGAVLVGHSNTVPDMASALCGCAVGAMDETEYDRRLTISIDVNGRASLAHSRDP